MEFPCKRSASPDHQYTCFICLKHRRSPKTRAKKDNVLFVKETSIPVIKSMYEFWKTKANIPDKITTALSVLREAFAASDIPSLAWHREKCRPIFMNKSYAERHPSIEDPSTSQYFNMVVKDENMETEPSKPFLRTKIVLSAPKKILLSN